MAVEISLQGADSLQRLARDLREAGDKDLQRELYRGLERATKPAKEAARLGAQRLPRRGGLAARVAAAKLSTKRRMGRTAGIRIVASGGFDLRSIDRGRLRHPVFGNRRAWVNQSVRPGWFSDAMEDQAPTVRRELVQVLDDVADRLRRG